MLSPIFGGFAVARSSNLADNQCINLYPELVETRDGKTVGALIGTPGLDMLATIGNGPIRALRVLGTYLYVVSGIGLYQVDASYHSTLLGTLEGPGAYVYSLNPSAAGFSAITLPFTPFTDSAEVSLIDDGVNIGVFLGMSATQQDGYGLLAEPNSYKLWQSNLVDLTTWPALNFAEASADPDHIVALASIHREVFVIKEEHTEVWINAGQAGFAFERLDGVYVEVGCLAPQSVARSGETLIWLARNAQGQNMIVQMNGYTPTRISTHALEAKIAAYARADDAVAYTYSQEGHAFYVISFPTGGETWVYDATESAMAGVPLWHQRAVFANGLFARHWGWNHALFGGRNVIGDYRNGNLYAIDMATTTDAGTQRKWLRSWRAIAQPVEQPVRFPPLRIDMQSGIGVAQNANPQCVLRWSDDGGHLWSSAITAAIGNPGMTAQRVRFPRLGSTRRGSGLDRIFELSSSDQFPVAIVGAAFEDFAKAG